jgi:hypothetical protein
MSKHNNDHNSGGRTARERYSESANTPVRRKVPDWLKIVVNITFIIPIVFCIVFSTGWWEIAIEDGKIVKDGWDTFIISASIFSGLMGLICIHMVFSYYEDR